MSSEAAPGGPSRTLVPMLGILGVVAAQFAWVKPTNFGGFDEWLILSLVDRGITDVAHANRPLALLWSLPARWGPASLWTYHALHCLYLAGTGCLAFLLWRRLRPELPALAFLAGALAASWSPLDYHRLNGIQPYAAYPCFTLLAIVLFVESWLREEPALLWLAGLLAFLDLRAYEASGALLLGAPLCLLLTRRRPARPWTWIAAWQAVVGFGMALAALPLLLPSRGDAYQQGMLGGVDLDPLRVVQRLLEQFGYHLLPVLTTPPSELAVPAVPVAAAAFGLFFSWTVRRQAREEPSRAGALGLMLLGLALAGLGYGVLVLSSGLSEAARTQFLSAPGIGLLLASSFALLATALPGRWRGPALGVLGAWVVAVGTGRTVALQRFWDQVSVHGDQVRLLRSLVEQAPRLKPNTFLILLDEKGAFEVTSAFRHALLYLYQGEAVGYAWGKWDVLFALRQTPEGLSSEPWPLVRQAWREPVTFHRFDEVLVLHQPVRGPLRLLEEWPAVLPPLPPGARYEPRSRIAAGPPPRQRRVLLAPSLP